MVLCFPSRFFFILLLLLSSSSNSSANEDQSHQQQQQEEQPPEAPMDNVEKQAFYKLLDSINNQFQWRTLLPDPCGTSMLQGMSCDSSLLGDDKFHITSLSFGSLQSNTPQCGSNATIDAAAASSLPALSSLSFFGCFSSSPGTSMPDSLPPSLRSLTFQNNAWLTGPISGRLLAGLPLLERLVITANPRLEGSIPSEIGSLGRSLRQLVVRDSPSLGGALPSALTNLTSLVVLDLSGNSLQGPLPAGLAGSALRKVDLSGNRLSGDLTAALTGATSVELLDLRRNLFNGSFPSSLLPEASASRTVRLRELYLGSNPMVGSLPDRGWQVLASSLISMDLSDSLYDGKIPAGIGELRSLRFLGLARNKFRGQIPASLSKLGSISEIDVSGNSLVGKIPLASDTVERLGRNLKVAGNRGLCVDSRRTGQTDSDPAAGPTVPACSSPSSSLPLAFAAGEGSPSASTGAASTLQSSSSVLALSSLSAWMLLPLLLLVRL